LFLKPVEISIYFSLEKNLNSRVVRFIAVFMVLVMMGALFIGGSQPGAGSLFPVPWDKLMHIGYFFVFSLILHKFIGLPLVVVIVLALVLGLADEIHQSFLPGRTAAWDDFVADATGVALAFTGYIFKRK